MSRTALPLAPFHPRKPSAVDSRRVAIHYLLVGMNNTYDGDGNRVEKSNGKLYWYGAGTEILEETDATGSMTNSSFSEYIYFAGKRVARHDASGNVFYYVQDALGTTDGMVEITANDLTETFCYDADFYPYGGEKVYTNTCPQNYKFEGKERDTESGNDDFGARYYSSVYGRWLSPDWSSIPAPVPYANLSNPQTLNLYAMVADNPETFADLDGHDCSDEGHGGSCESKTNSDQYIGNAGGYPSPGALSDHHPSRFLRLPNRHFLGRKQCGGPHLGSAILVRDLCVRQNHGGED